MIETQGSLYFEDYRVGDGVTSPGRTITETDIVMFAAMTADYIPLHTNEEYAKTTQHGTRISHGAMVFAYAVGLMTRMRLNEESAIALAGIDEMRMHRPVKPGDTIHCVQEVLDKRESKSKPDRGLLTTQVTVRNQHDQPVLSYKSTVMLRKRLAKIE